MPEQPSIEKQEGTTAAERYLARLCSKSFLSLWSYPGIYRDQGRRGAGDGKEICDLIVIFGDDIVIFSDKDCQFPNSGNLDRDWARWFRRAVLNSADQLWGAERWIKQNPTRLFVDRRCSQPIPMLLPDAASMRIHRVVVAHGVARRCIDLFGGNGGLVILPFLIGEAHVKGPTRLPEYKGDLYENWHNGLQRHQSYNKTVLPFAVGDIEKSKGFIHVFDETMLNVILSELDTATDFIEYLRARELFIRGGRLLFAASESDLLAYYLANFDGYSWRSFQIPGDPDTKVIIPEGEWAALLSDPAWAARKREDLISYKWDRLIEEFNISILNGTSPAFPTVDIHSQELAARAMARTSRYQRRRLAFEFYDFLKTKRKSAATAKIFWSQKQGAPCYIFLVMRPNAGEEYQSYRERRWAISFAYALETKRRFQDIGEVVVLATEIPGSAPWETADVIYRSSAPLLPNEVELVQEFASDHQILVNFTEIYETEAPEYPIVPPKRPPFVPNSS